MRKAGYSFLVDGGSLGSKAGSAASNLIESVEK
jgi:hypothetical protein